MKIMEAAHILLTIQGNEGADFLKMSDGHPYIQHQEATTRLRSNIPPSRSLRSHTRDFLANRLTSMCPTDQVLPSLLVLFVTLRNTFLLKRIKIHLRVFFLKLCCSTVCI